MKKQGNLKPEIPSQGWQQFLTSKQEMLDAFDKARKQSKGHKVETYHGRVAEGKFREWLSTFLPKKYGVTSGYIISQGIPAEVKAPHFDIIIYDQLEAPVLWIEDNPDSSEQGKSRAIPAEYVRAVFEVKSAFKNKNVIDAIKHLSELSDLMSGIDDVREKYKLYLPENFLCGTIFFELRDEDAYDKNALKSMLEGVKLRGFIDGIILRGYGKEQTGKISVIRSDKPRISVISKPTKSFLSSNFSDSDTIEVETDVHLGTILTWFDNYFAQFAFDLLTMLNGTYEKGVLSSFHVFGFNS